MKTTGAAIKLLIFAVITTAATLVLAVTISNTQFVPMTKYRAIFSDVTGLVEGDEVRIAGVRVGQVGNIRLYQGNLAQIEFQVFSSQRLPRSSEAQVRFRDLTGARYVALSQGSGDGGELPRDGNGLIPLAHTQPALDLNAVFNGFRPLLRALKPEEVNQVTYQIIQVFQGEGGTINGLLAHVGSLSNTLADRDVVIGRVITNLNQVVGTLAQRDKQVSSLVMQLRTFVSGLAADRGAIGNSLVSINDLIGVTDSLVTEARPSIKEDVAGIGKLAETFANNDKIVDDILARLPSKLNTLNRAASYGSWFNFYLCSLDARIKVPGAPAITTPRIVNENARCK